MPPSAMMTFPSADSDLLILPASWWQQQEQNTLLQNLWTIVDDGLVYWKLCYFDGHQMAWQTELKTYRAFS